MGINMKNEPVMEIANKFVNDCDNFEIKNLDNNRGRVDDLPEIELCSDYIKAHIKGEKDQFKKHIIETGNEKLDEIGFLEKGSFKLFYTKDENLQVQRITNNIILEAVGNSKRVMSLSTCLSFAVGQYQSTMMRKLGEEDVADWFDDKPLFICEYYETDDVMAIIQEIDTKIDALGIEVLYLPNLEYSLINCPADLQLDTLSFLYDLAFDKQICVVATLSPFYEQGDKGVFYTMQRIDEEAFKSILPMESNHNVISDDNKLVTIECWDYWDFAVDAPRTVMFKSNDEFYTFSSITSYTNGFEDYDLPF